MIGTNHFKPTFNLNLPIPRIEETKEQKDQRLKKWKQESLDKAISDFLEKKQAISSDLWEKLHRFHVVSSEDSFAYSQSCEKDEDKFSITAFHLAILPYVELLKQYEGKIPLEFYPKSYVRFTPPPSSPREIEN